MKKQIPSIFDFGTGFFSLEEDVLERPSLKSILQDELVTDEEVREQRNHTVALLKELDFKQQHGA